jgi:hypothetical protein
MTLTRDQAVELADRIAENPPASPTGRHDDWQHGWQDGAMEVAAALRAVPPAPVAQDEVALLRVIDERFPSVFAKIAPSCTTDVLAQYGFVPRALKSPAPQDDKGR